MTTSDQCILTLAEQIKQLTCMIGTGGDKFIEDRLSFVFQRAEQVCEMIMDNGPTLL